MQTERTEGPAEHELEAFGHVTAPRVREERVATEIGALKRAPHDLVQVDDAGELAGRAHHDEMALVRPRIQPLDIGAKRARCERRRGPSPQERAASTRCRQEIT